ncbi:IPExxxVDY family protein [Bacteroidota bacterium]
MKKTSIPADSEKLLLLGIVSFEKDYRLIYFINKEINLNLVKSQELLTLELPQQAVEVHFFEYSNPDFDFLILSNKQNGSYILDKYKNIDFLLILKPKGYSYNVKELEKKINSVSAIIGLFNISDVKEISYLKGLLFQ